MKRKLMLIAALGLLPVFTLFGQTEKGKVLLGLSSRYSLSPLDESLGYTDLMTLGFSTVKFKSDESGEEESDLIKFTGFNFTPKAGYFIIDNLSLGLDVNIGMASMKETYDQNEYNETGTVLSAGPFVRYYLPLEKVLPYIEASATLGSSKLTYDSGSDKEVNKSSLNTLMGGVGFAAPIGDIVTFDLMLGYLSMTMKDKEDNPHNERMVIGTLGFKFGVVLLL